MFSRIKGQERIIALLKNALTSERISNSYLFQGQDGVGKFTTALYFGMALNCLAMPGKRPCGTCNSCQKFLKFNHPDLVYVFPFPNYELDQYGRFKSDKVQAEYSKYIQLKIEQPWQDYHFSTNTEIRIKNIRLLEYRASMSPNEGNYKVFLIEHADEMNTQAANAFLKTLEEPPSDTVIILTTSKPNSLLPTIISRCQQVNFQPLSRAVIEKELIEKHFLDPIDARMYARISGGNMKKARQIAGKSPIQSREDLTQLLNILISGDDLRFIAFAAEFKSSRCKDRLREIISQLTVWINDMLYLETQPELIVNLDKKELLTKFKSAAPLFQMQGAELTDFLEKMRWKLEGHVNPQLILTGIYNKFDKIINSNRRS